MTAASSCCTSPTSAAPAFERERAQRAHRLNAAIRDALSPGEQRHIRECVPLLARLTSRMTGL